MKGNRRHWNASCGSINVPRRIGAYRCSIFSERWKASSAFTRVRSRSACLFRRRDDVASLGVIRKIVQRYISSMVMRPGGVSDEVLEFTALSSVAQLRPSSSEPRPLLRPLSYDVSSSSKIRMRTLRNLSQDVLTRKQLRYFLPSIQEPWRPPATTVLGYTTMRRKRCIGRGLYRQNSSD
jgi:hypothetical protein